MAVQAGGRLQEDAGGALLLPTAAAQGDLHRRRPPCRCRGTTRRRRRRVQAVVVEQLQPAPAERALRRGHCRLRRVLQQVCQGRPQVKATLLIRPPANYCHLSIWVNLVSSMLFVHDRCLGSSILSSLLHFIEIPNVKRSILDPISLSNLNLRYINRVLYVDDVAHVHRCMHIYFAVCTSAQDY